MCAVVPGEVGGGVGCESDGESLLVDVDVVSAAQQDQVAQRSLQVLCYRKRTPAICGVAVTGDYGGSRSVCRARNSHGQL